MSQSDPSTVMTACFWAVPFKKSRLYANEKIERLQYKNEDKMKTEMTQLFNQYSENETKIWRQNILNQFNRVSSFCLRSHS